MSEFDLEEARLAYADAVLLFYRTEQEQYATVIELLDKAVSLCPDFLDASLLREEAWHKRLKKSYGTRLQDLIKNLYLNPKHGEKSENKPLNVMTIGVFVVMLKLRKFIIKPIIT